jgi:tRNA A37 threonylcarbamoyladenosine synthetase subunit TsaC/SUA5/YrdC
MARYFDVHPLDPQPRSISQIVALLRDDALIAYPTDASYALGCQIGNPTGPERIRQLRGLDERHHFTLVCADFAQLGQLVMLPATGDVPRRLAHPKKRTVGVRIPNHPFVRALLHELGEPLVSSTLLLPDDDEPLTDGWQIKEELDNQLDAVVDAGECSKDLTTVVDWSQGYPEVLRVGMGDPVHFQ